MKKVFLLLLCLAMVAMPSCRKKIDVDVKYSVLTKEADTPVNSVKLYAKVSSSVDLAQVTAGGFLVSESQSFPSGQTKEVPSSGEIDSNGDFSATLSVNDDLEGKRGKTFYYKAWITLSGKRETGEAKSFVCPVIKVESITISKTYLRIDPSLDDVTLTVTVKPDNATDKTVVWSSDDKKIATVTQSGVVRGVKAGKTIIKASSGDVSAECEVSVKGDCPSGAVDLGFGPYWRTSVILVPPEGVDYYYSPGHNGPWYRWGELRPKTVSSEYAATTYDFAKYGSMKRLSLEDDAAHDILGGTWRIPTRDEFQMLLDNCTYSKSGSNTGWYTVTFTSKINANTLRFECEGYVSGTTGDYGAGSGGFHWTSTSATDNTAYLFRHCYKDNMYPGISTYSKAFGASIAAVAD